MNKTIITILLALTLVACSRDSGSKYTPPPQNSLVNWTSYAGTVSGTCDNFNFGEPHYCIKSMSVKAGQTIRMTFTTSGTGMLYPPGDIPPPMITLFLWRRGDDLSCAGPMQQFRYWLRPRVPIVVGTTQTITAVIDPANFTDCYGKSGADNPAAFAAALQNLYAVGYTFGGASFAGHGVAANGQVHFTLNSYTVGALGLKWRRRAAR